MAQPAIRGTLKSIGVPGEACFTNFSELLNLLGTYLVVEIANQNFSNIIISNSQPAAADRNKIWWRLSNNGSFVGIFAYSGGVWVQIFPAPQQIFWLYGNSASPPQGFSFAAVQTVFSSGDYTQLMTMAIPSGPGPYTYYPALYVGL